MPTSGSTWADERRHSIPTRAAPTQLTCRIVCMTAMPACITPLCRMRFQQRVDRVPHHRDNVAIRCDDHHLACGDRHEHPAPLNAERSLSHAHDAGGHPVGRLRRVRGLGDHRGPQDLLVEAGVCRGDVRACAALPLRDVPRAAGPSAPRADRCGASGHPAGHARGGPHQRVPLTDLDGLLRGLSGARLRTNAKHIGLEVRGAAEPIHVISDEAIARRVLGALISRAVLVTPAGEVSVALEAAADGIRLEIIDAGPAIPEAEIGMLFEPFGRMRTANGLRPDASGLSLAMAVALAVTLRGTIEVRPERGARTHLIVTLPDMTTHE